MTDQFVTEDNRCGQCGTPIESWEAEPCDEAINSLWERVTMSTWTTLQPCGHAFKRATGASLD